MKSSKNKKIAVYTCIIGDYDNLKTLSYYDSQYDYVCYTDQPFESNVGEIRQVPEKLKKLSNVKQQRYIKTHPHEFFKEYDFSIGIDGNTDIKTNLDVFLEKNCSKDRGYIFIGKHPQRDCIYKEAKVVVMLLKDTIENIQPQIDRYRNEGFPENFGLHQTCILFRYHNNYKCIKLMENGWYEINKGSHRDQLSLSYVLGKNKNIKVCNLDSTIFNSEGFFFKPIHKNFNFFFKTSHYL